MKYAFHPIAESYPLLPAHELKKMGESIRTHEQLEPVWLFDGMILDGRNRYLACEAEGIAPRFEEYTGNDPCGFVEAKNENRRHMTPSQRALAAAKVANALKGRQNKSATLQIKTRAEAADEYKVSERTVADAAKVIADAEPEIVEAVATGSIPVATAAKASELPPKKQREIAKAKDPKKAAQEAVKEVKKEPKIIAPVAVDEWDIPIQPHAEEAFAAVPKFKELVSAISAAQKLFNEVANLPGGKFLTLPDVSSYRRGKKTGDNYADRFVHEGLEKALKQVQNATPTHTVCPWHYVDGKHPEECGTCKGLNWTPVLGSNIPDMARERARKKFKVKED